MDSLKKRVMIKMAATLLVVLLMFILLPGHKSPVNSKINGAVIDELAEKEKARVMIYMEEGADESKGSFLGISFASDKDKVIDQISSEIRYDLGNVISAELGEAEILALTSNDAVSSVELVESRELFLLNSPLIIQSELVNKLSYLGMQLTGKGQTVCILDTGVDYTHADLGNCSNATFLSNECDKVIGGYDYVNNDNNPIDDHGHGTHVAGIVSANGKVRGIAPEAKIAAVKVCSDKGVCYDDDLIAGLQWCINNKDRLNISVISMSLGSGLYENYCNDDVLAPYINNASAQNISVVLASGNYGDKKSISAPACVQNATPVGSTTKADAISSFSNRNSLLKLMAPGSLIYSTLPNGRYSNLSGTSMSTPHVSGAIALINQYLSLKGKTMIPSEIEDLLFTTGKVIEDASWSGLNYSRIDIFSALVELDDDKPLIENIGEIKDYGELKEITACNASDFALANSYISVWNNLGEMIINEEENLSLMSEHKQSFNLTNVSYGVYSWNCGYKDASGNYNSMEQNRSIVFSDIISGGNYPPANSLIKAEGVEFICNASSGFGLKEIGLRLMNSSNDLISEKNSSISGFENSSVFYEGLEDDGNYSWICSAVDDLGGRGVSEQYGFIFESTEMDVRVNSPENGSVVNSAVLNVSIEREGRCDYTLLGNSSEMLTSDNKTFIFGSLSLEDGWYEIEFSCLSFDERRGDTNVSFKLDSKSPAVTLANPSNDASLNKGNVGFSYNTDEESICKLIIGNSNYTINSTKTLSLSIGNYAWRIECSDIAGNIGVSETRTLKIIESETKKENKPSSATTTSPAKTTPLKTTPVKQNITTPAATNEVKKEVIASTELEGARTIAGQAIREDITTEEVDSLKQRAVVLCLLAIIGIVGIVVTLYYRRGMPLFKPREEKLLEHKLK